MNVEPPETLVIIEAIVYKSNGFAIYAYAAVVPQLCQMTSLVLRYPNTKIMNLLLKQVKARFSRLFYHYASR